MVKPTVKTKCKDIKRGSSSKQAQTEASGSTSSIVMKSSSRRKTGLLFDNFLDPVC